MTARNPFHYGTPAEGDHFTGRREELDALVARMRDGINLVLVSPAVTARTSRHRAAQALLAASRPAGAVIEVTLLHAASPARFAGLLAAAAYRLPGARSQWARQAVPEFLHRLRLAPSVSFDPGGQPRSGFDAALSLIDLEAVLTDVYGLLAEVHQQRPAALILDELQAVDLVGDRLPELLKGLADDHPGVSLVLAGSHRHLMERLVTRQEAPMYGMAQRLALGPIPEAQMLAYLRQRAGAGGRPLDEETARALVELAGPVPNDIQHLAYDTFEAATAAMDAAALEAGMTRAVGHDAAFFADALERMSPGQVRVLTALAQAPTGEPYSAAFARSVGLASGSSVRKALQPLLERDDVASRDGRLVVADPFFAAWLRGAPS